MRKFAARGMVMALLALATAGIAATSTAPTASACSSQENSSAYAATLPQVNPGDRGAEVKGMQLRLRELGYGLNGTGLYADNTLSAVKDFQRKHGINDSGIVGSKTWQKLVGVLPKFRTENLWATTPQLNPGDRNPAAVTQVIDHLMRITDGEVPGGANGVYDAPLADVVKQFQRQVGIKDSGIVGAKTWHALSTVVSVRGNWGC
ncbi:peptidoglycan-binding domain-containing protein [Crossiella cryophila]|uniref:Peptidoglycan hydrolase-like protein with peptidoglycan-binding domain n=1 Tax=Crossiella cryophila TaxID=43355 RepID=A0A7W7FQ81_9PSEU|nr:peptidoglycan-binding protein [Crossiella cryophila]MBB4674646.1 peptidoglycan hydrolase-like protein with peptidoglycan-binding domain [Crossiella cryophila]